MPLGERAVSASGYRLSGRDCGSDVRIDRDGPGAAADRQHAPGFFGIDRVPRAGHGDVPGIGDDKSASAEGVQVGAFAGEVNVGAGPVQNVDGVDAVASTLVTPFSSTSAQVKLATPSKPVVGVKVQFRTAGVPICVPIFVAQPTRSAKVLISRGFLRPSDGWVGFFVPTIAGFAGLRRYLYAMYHQREVVARADDIPIRIGERQLNALIVFCLVDRFSSVCGVAQPPEALSRADSGKSDHPIAQQASIADRPWWPSRVPSRSAR
jgi:hypothetical protein